MNGPLWSLYIEVKIYIIAMFAALIMAGRLGTKEKIVSAVGFCFFLFVLVPTFAFLAIWILGSLFALIVQGHVMKRSFCKLAYCCAGAISLFYCAVNPSLFMPNYISTVAGFGASIALSVILAGIMFDLQFGARVISLFSGTAKYSYTLYIVHFPLLLLAFSLTHQMLSSNPKNGYLIVVCGSTFAATLLVAHTIARYFENKPYFETLIKLIVSRLIVITFGLLGNIKK